MSTYAICNTSLRCLHHHYQWKHLCSCVSDLLYLCMNSCICVKTSKQREKKVILYLGKDICHCYWINLSRLPRHSLPFKTACHLAALVSVEEEEGGGEESWKDEVDEGKRWLVSQPAADVANTVESRKLAHAFVLLPQNIWTRAQLRTTQSSAHNGTMNPMLR